MADELAPNASDSKKQRTQFNQSDFPLYSLESALRIPQAIWDHYAGHPTAPLDIAIAINASPSSSVWRYLTGTAVAYGLTNGGYKLDRIQLTPLARRIVAPTEAGDDLQAKREAILKPRIMREFYQRYHNARYPDDNIAGNVLASLGLPKDRIESAMRILKENARYVQIIKQSGNNQYLDLNAAISPANATTSATTDVVSPSQDGNDSQPLLEQDAALDRPAVKPPLRQLETFGGPTLHIDVQIHISADASPDQIDKIFESMAKHLYNRS